MTITAFIRSSSSCRPGWTTVSPAGSTSPTSPPPPSPEPGPGPNGSLRTSGEPGRVARRMAGDSGVRGDEAVGENGGHGGRGRGGRGSSAPPARTLIPNFSLIPNVSSIADRRRGGGEAERGGGVGVRDHAGLQRRGQLEQKAPRRQPQRLQLTSVVDEGELAGDLGGPDPPVRLEDLPELVPRRVHELLVVGPHDAAARAGRHPEARVEVELVHPVVVGVDRRPVAVRQQPGRRARASARTAAA